MAIHKDDALNLILFIGVFCMASGLFGIFYGGDHRSYSPLYGWLYKMLELWLGYNGRYYFNIFSGACIIFIACKKNIIEMFFYFGRIQNRSATPKC